LGFGFPFPSDFVTDPAKFVVNFVFHIIIGKE
jgi:hypothetical protein